MDEEKVMAKVAVALDTYMQVFHNQYLGIDQASILYQYAFNCSTKVMILMYELIYLRRNPHFQKYRTQQKSSTKTK